jgi:outer membrane protein OmpU
MKKVLFATTALVATAGVAAADVTFGGYGRFGVLHQETASGDDETNVTSRFRLQIDATAESDMGVTFGARARIQQNNTDDSPTYSVGPDGTAGTADDVNGSTGPSGTGINGVRFFARTGGFEVGVGNIYGALESMPGMYEIDLGLTGLAYEYTAYNFRGDAYSSGGNGAAGSNGVEALYSMGDLKVHISASDTNDRVAGYVAYTFNGFTFAAAAQDSNDAGDTDYALSVVGNVGPAKVSFAYADNGDDTGAGTVNGDHYALTASFDIGAATNLDVYVADADYFEETSYGIGAHHDLGGGVSLRGGIVNRGNDTIRADMGVRFTF